MRIATSTIYDNQAVSIDNLSAQYQNIGQQLSTGKSLNVPSDDPAQVSQDLTLTSSIAHENSDASNASAAQNYLTFTDTTLSQLTGILQSARSLAVEGATDIIPNGGQRPLIGKQVAGMVDQVLALANSQYGGTYLFAGTGSGTTPPVTPLGSPPNGIVFTGNNQVRSELINGQQVQVGTTLQQAFNQGSTNGTPSVFTLLTTLRDTLDQEPASIQSQQPINVTGQVIQGNAADNAPTTLGQLAAAGGPSTIRLTPDNSLPAPGNYTITIDGTTNLGAAGTQTFTFNNATTVPGMIAAINAAVNVTGVTASWNDASQRLQLTSSAANSPPFLVNDTPTPSPPAAAAATTTANLLEVFQIPNQVSVTSNLSTQIGDIDAVVNQVLSARAAIGQQIQNLAGTTSQLTSLSNDNVTTQSTIQDTNIAQATSQFTLTQTALQAAYATTSRLEGKTLIDYLDLNEGSPMVNAPAESAVKTVDLPRFGTCTYNEAEIFVFPWGLPGFEELRSFIVLQLETQDQILWLQSLEDPNIALPLGDPWTFFPDYDPKIPGFARLSLDLQNPEDFTILAVMVGTDGGPTFMNLMAPIVVNLKSRIARQVPLETSRYTVAMEIPVPEAVAQARAQAQTQAEAVPE